MRKLGFLVLVLSLALTGAALAATYVPNTNDFRLRAVEHDFQSTLATVDLAGDVDRRLVEYLSGFGAFVVKVDPSVLEADVVASCEGITDPTQTTTATAVFPYSGGYTFFGFVHTPPDLSKNGNRLSWGERVIIDQDGIRSSLLYFDPCPSGYVATGDFQLTVQLLVYPCHTNCVGGGPPTTKQGGYVGLYSVTVSDAATVIVRR